MLYAVVDIETTGGYANASSITEIAIVVTDGENILDQYETLINPHQKIPYFITRLTGITDAMVATAPSFDEVAEKIYSILHDKIFVAHNVSFDYSFVNHQLKQNGFALHNKKLCTVKYGKKVITGLPSYSLGNFCKSVNIPLTQRHRAMGDCYATALLLQFILKNDTQNTLELFIKNNKHQNKNLPLQLAAVDYNNLPTSIGVYYFLDSKQKIIYIGKAINIKKRVASHFSGNATTKQRQEFIRNIAYIKFQLVATELMSLLLESVEIKKHWPKYNQAQKQFEPKFALYSYTNQNGYLQLCVDKWKKNFPSIISVKNKVEGLQVLGKMVTEANLCPSYCQVAYLNETTNHINCNGTCTHYYNAASYNQAVQSAINTIQDNTKSFLLIDEGLEPNQVSVVAVEKGNFIAMGYLPKTKNNKYSFKQYQDLEPYPNNNFTNSIVNNYAEQNQHLLTYQ
jgi:DNA polymerase III subunit epsilon